MSSSGTLRRATPDEVLAGLLVERELVEAELVNDVRAALADEADGGNIIEALIDSEILPLETAELFVDELSRGILTCPGCPGRFNVGSLARGARFKCKTCGTAVTVPAMEVTRDVLGQFGWADGDDRGGDGGDDGDINIGGGDIDLDGGDFDLPAAAPPPRIEEVRPTVTSDEDAIDQAMAVGTGEGQLLDFTNADVSQETIDGTAPLGTPITPKSRPKRSSPKRSSPKRSSRRAAAARADHADRGDDELNDDADDVDTDAFDEFDDDDEHAPKAKPQMMMWIVWVVIPVAACALVMYYTADIKTWMFGGPENDDGGYYEGAGGGSRGRSGGGGGGGTYQPSIKAEECDDWASAVTSADAALATVTAARDAASAGDPGAARTKFAQAGDQFQEAYEFWDEVVVLYGNHCDHLQDTVDAWVKAHEAAEAEAAKLN